MVNCVINMVPIRLLAGVERCGELKCIDSMIGGWKDGQTVSHTVMLYTISEITWPMSNLCRFKFMSSHQFSITIWYNHLRSD